MKYPISIRMSLTITTVSRLHLLLVPLIPTMSMQLHANWLLEYQLLLMSYQQFVLFLPWSATVLTVYSYFAIQCFFLFKPDDIVMNTQEVTNQLGGFNQCLQMRQSNKHFPHSGNHRNGDNAIDIFISSLKYHNGNTAVEPAFCTKTLLADVYAIRSKYCLNITKVP